MLERWMLIMEFDNKQKKILEEKCLIAGVKPEALPNEIQEALLNDYVDSYRKGRLVYTKEFYRALDKKIKSGMIYVESYKALGFDVNALGEDRANAACRRAKKMSEEGTLYKADPTDYDGTVPMKKMSNLSDDEMLAYLKARCMYLEVALDYEKKKKQ